METLGNKFLLYNSCNAKNVLNKETTKENTWAMIYIFLNLKHAKTTKQGWDSN